MRVTVQFFARYPGRLVIVWSESPAIERFFARLGDVGLHIGSPGKGRACWLALGYLLAEERADYIAFQDADVVNFSREMIARLILPALDPIVDFDFVKAYYALHRFRSRHSPPSNLKCRQSASPAPRTRASSKCWPTIPIPMAMR